MSHGTVTIHRGDTLPYDVATGPGIYAWYWAPSIPLYEIRSAAANPDPADKLYRLILENVVEPYQMPGYNVTFSAPLRPEFVGQLRHTPPQLSRLRNLVIKDPSEEGAIRLRDFLQSHFTPFFAAPVYVGLAARQSLRNRIQQHLADIGKYRNTHPSEREKLLEELLSQKPEEGGILWTEGHLFALEVVARNIELRDLRLATLQFADVPSDNEAAIIEVVEELVNRMVYPSFGRR
jgi:hypothetical protein